jgi:ligand-binding sensor domain-containing protein/DNA-binding CsgD family transcriptional regulator
MHFDHLTIEEGLSHNTVFDIIQDFNGYIWIGTQNGLNKYDGYSFEVYRSNGSKEDHTGFVGKAALSLFEDREGNLWVGTRRQGVNIRRKGSDRFVNLQNEAAFSPIRGYEVSSFFEDEEGNIWITTIEGGILEYNPRTKKSNHFTIDQGGLLSDAAFDVVEDKYGAIWIATAGPGINYRKGNGKMAAIETGLNGYRKKLLLEDDFLWIATEGTGLYRMHVQDHTLTQFAQHTNPLSLSSDIIRDIHRGADGRLFLASDGGGLYVYDEAEGSILNYTSQSNNNELNTNALLSFWEDRTGNLWIGTFNGGVNIYKANKTWFDFFSPILEREEELSNRSILSICQASDGKIWVGTDGGGLTYLNTSGKISFARTFTHNPEDPNSLPDNVVKTIFEDSKGRIWLGFFGEGMALFDPQLETFRHFPNEAGNPYSVGGEGANVWAFSEGKDGTIYIALIGGGLTAFDTETETFTQYPIGPEIPLALAETDLMTVLVDREDRLWAGTADRGLHLWDDSLNGFLRFQHDATDSVTISNDEIRAIIQDSKGNIWIGTEGGGLNRWKGENHFEHITEADGLISNSVMGITEDQEGNLWISTFEGISRYNPSSGDILNFDFHSGENSNQFNQMAILTADNGQLLFGGINGLHAILPNQVKERQQSSDILFTNLHLFNQPVTAGSQDDGRTILDRPIEEADVIRLHYYDNSFSITFAAIDYTAPLENTFSFKMEGFNETWQQTTSGQHNANYTNLDPGTYTFRVKHASNEVSIKVNIRPPFWKTIWFRSLVVIVLSVLIVLGTYFLIQRRDAIHKRKLLEAETEILHLQNEKLETEVNAKNSKLMFSAVQMAHKNEILTFVKEEVTNLDTESQQKRRKLLQMLNQELKSENYWKEFNLYFNQVDSNFNQAMMKKHPELTSNDLRICALIRINLTTKEIASLLNISVRGVEQSRYRLKKRLGLGSEENLVKYITGFDSQN